MASVYTILSNCFRYDITTSPQENGYDVRVERYRMSEHNLGVPCTTVIQQSIFSTRKKYRVDNTKQLNLLLYIHKRFKVPSRACFDILKYSSGKHVEIIYNEDGSITSLYLSPVLLSLSDSSSSLLETSSSLSLCDKNKGTTRLIIILKITHEVIKHGQLPFFKT